MGKIKFRVLSLQEFKEEFPDEYEIYSQVDDLNYTTYGKVKIPGHGWCACVIDDTSGNPAYFCDGDDWEEVPADVVFKKID